MGITLFLAKANTEQEVTSAVVDVVKHNQADMVELGGQYTDEEFAVLDPRRHASNQMLRAQHEAMDPETAGVLILGCQEKWTRGEDLQPKMLVFERDGDWWVETTNGGGGACTTLWLEAHGRATWHGTRGKPFAISKDDDPIIVPPTAPPEFLRKWAAAAAARA